MAVTIVAAIFLCLLYRLIFSFSAQDGETSSSLSGRITSEVVNLISSVSGGMSEETQFGLNSILEPIIRKLAHFSEYGVMGVLVFTIWCQWISKPIILSLPWVFISAALDEWHQTFVPGRDGNIVDVGIDTLGGICGFLVCIILIKLWKHIHKKKTC